MVPTVVCRISRCEGLRDEIIQLAYVSEKTQSVSEKLYVENKF